MTYIIDHPTLSSGLIAYFPCRGYCQDESGNNNHGYRCTRYNLSYWYYNLENNPPAVIAPVPSGRAYYNTQEYAGFTSEAHGGEKAAWAVDNLTLSCWAYYGGDVREGAYIFYHYGLGLTWFGGITTQPMRIYFNGATTGAFSPERYQDNYRNAWHHYIVSYSSNNARAYIDGALVASHTVTGPMRKDAAQTFYFADSGYGTSATNGNYQSDIGVWNRQLSDSECYDLYISQGLKLFEPVDDRKTRYWTFNGSNYMNLTSANGSGNYNPTGNFTLAAAVKLNSVGSGIKHTIFSKISPSEGGYELYIDNATLKFRVYKTSTVFTEVSCAVPSGEDHFVVYGRYTKAISKSGIGRLEVGALGGGGPYYGSSNAVGSVAATTADVKIGAGTLGGNLIGRMYWVAYVPRAAGPELYACNSYTSDYVFTPAINQYTSADGKLPIAQGIWDDFNFNPPRMNPSLFVDFHRNVTTTYPTDLPVESPRTLDVNGTPVQGGDAASCLKSTTQYWDFPLGQTTYLSTPSHADLNPSGDFSIIFCGMFYDRYATGGFTGLVSKFGASPQYGYRLTLGYDSGNAHLYIAYFTVSSNGTAITYVGAPRCNQLNQYVVITATYKYNGAGNINTGTIYANDVTPRISNVMAGPVYASTAPFLIGANGTDASAGMFHGKMFYTAYFRNRVITESEHRNLLVKNISIDSLSPTLLLRCDQHPTSPINPEVGSYPLTIVNDVGRLTLNGISEATSNPRGLAELRRLRKKPF